MCSLKPSRWSTLSYKKLRNVPGSTGEPEVDEAAAGEVALGAGEAVGVEEVAVEVADLVAAAEAEVAMEAAGNGPIIIFEYLELKITSFCLCIFSEQYRCYQ